MRFAKLSLENLEERIVPSTFRHAPNVAVQYAFVQSGNTASGTLTFESGRVDGVATFTKVGSDYQFAFTMNRPNVHAEFSITASSAASLEHGFLSEVRHLATHRTHFEWTIAVIAAEKTFI